jgi:hypothetical protein
LTLNPGTGVRVFPDTSYILIKVKFPLCLPN